MLSEDITGQIAAGSSDQALAPAERLEAPPARPLDRRLLAVNLAVSLLAAMGVLVAVSMPSLANGHSTAWWPLLALVLILVQQFKVNLLTKRSMHGFDLTELPILIGAVVLPPSELLAAAFIAFVAWCVIHRPPLVRCVFNVANQMVGAGVAFVVLDSLIGRHPVLSLTGCLVMATALVAAETVVALNVMVVLTAVAGFPGRQYIDQLVVQILVLTPMNLTLGVAAISSYQAKPWALAGLTLPVLLVGWWYSRSEKMRHRFSDLQLLYAYSEALADAHDKPDVLQIALTETRRVLHCESAELCTAVPEGLVRYSLDADGHLVEDLIDWAGIESGVIESQNPVLVGPASRSPYLEQRGVKDAMAVPLSINGEPVAALVVTDRHGDAEKTFDRAEAAFMQALAAHLSTALTSSEYLEDLRRSVAQREHEAFHDTLTGMPNRTLFANVVEASLEQSGGNRTTAVVLLDLDGFREVNDALGHATGDSVLRVVGERVSARVSQFGTAARLGGDEFAFLVPAATSIDEVVALAEQVVEAVAAPMEIDAVTFNVRAAVGIAIAPIHGQEAATLLRNGDVAMYAAKRSGRRVQVYENSMDKSSARRLGLASDLAGAIEKDQLDLWYQPVADIVTGRVSGFEALLRWPHPELGFVAPDEFIPIAEQTGLIEPLTWWVMNEALGEIKRWQDSGYEFSVAVNVSVRSVLDTAVVERIRSLIAEHGLAPPCLTLEITESSMMVDFERCESVLRQISDMGVRIAIDDFGTGYSSLSRLKVLPVQVVKIDRAFVKGICFDRCDQAVVKSVIELADVMGYQTVAEGIEDLATWNRLASLGCDLAQGHYFARPMPAAQCREWVVERQPPSLGVVRALGSRRVETS